MPPGIKSKIWGMTTKPRLKVPALATDSIWVIPRKTKAAVIVVSSAAPALLVRLRTNIAGLLKTAAYLLGARTVGVIAVGLAARERHQRLSRGTMEKARLMGRKLVAGSGPGREG